MTQASLFRSVTLALLLSAAPALLAGQTSIPSRHIYPDVSAAKTDVAAALRQARQEHKRVILDFGGDWCPDCQVLDINFHKGGNLELLQRHFVLVHINIGHEDQNVDVASRYGVPVKKGVPALAVLDAQGKVLFAQSSGEFRDMRSMDPQSVTDFLNHWKG